MLWVLFFLICCGLGYPILNRYDPRTTPGIIDVFSYGQIIESGPGLSGRNSYRVLQPLVARPVYLLAKGGVRQWRPVCLALLASAATFVATTLVLLLAVGARSLPDAPSLVLAPFLYVCTFWVPNGMLAGLVDASEACVLMLLTWCLIARRSWLLPLVGVLGGLAKETFIPLSAVYAGAWWLVLAAKERRLHGRMLAGIVGMTVAATSMPTLVRLVVAGKLEWPWQLATALASSRPLGDRLLWLVSDPGFYLPFVWLAPLALWSLRRLPRPWLVAASAAAATAFVLGLYADAGGTNVSRPLFNILGAPMSIAAAATLAGIVGPRARSAGTSDA
jgi:hypothetical protein